MVCREGVSDVRDEGERTGRERGRRGERGRKETNTHTKLQITGLSVVKLAANKFQCECASSNFKSSNHPPLLPPPSPLPFFPLFFAAPSSFPSLISLVGVKFEVTIRESDVEYTPLEVVGHGMSECVKESIFFMREDWPIFLCKIIASMRH